MFSSFCKFRNKRRKIVNNLSNYSLQKVIEVAMRKKKRFATYSKYIANHLFLSLRYLLGDIPFILVKTRIKACALLNPEVSAI